MLLLVTVESGCAPLIGSVDPGAEPIRPAEAPVTVDGYGDPVAAPRPGAPTTCPRCESPQVIVKAAGTGLRGHCLMCQLGWFQTRTS